ncbi:beta-1,4-glucuronyltransferase 1 isoform X2 [Folsomia candida]|uniref:beta-1,4-glucuronyltransferase 1 isoform X2 n=1 Tax=Folsomia candida TaxID=158441 RepID=UPI001604CBF0|nr:beta-1,4-glucuronyltransferase 1 isoform X2 [Folsomia candida]
MHTIDRCFRLLKVSSRRRVIIILGIIGGLFLALNYVASNHEFTNKRFLPENKNQDKTILISHPRRYDFVTELTTPTITTNSEIGIISTITHYEDDRVNESSYKEMDKIINEYEPFRDQFVGFESVNSEINKNQNIFKNEMFSFSCETKSLRRAQKRNKNLVVYENFVISTLSMELECHQSITYTTHGDYRYLDNLIPLVDRWAGPVSIAIYSPGDDLKRTLKIISFLRDCNFQKIKQFVTFHLFFDVLYSESPVYGEQFQWLDSMYQKERWENCSIKPDPVKLRNENTFRMKHGLLYPVNVARNIARAAALTHFVLPSDIELYPSINLIRTFFEMHYEENKNNEKPVIMPARQVFVLPIFEIEKGVMPPQTKSELVHLLQIGEAIPFHYKISKRKPPFQFWEPIYIGTKYDPQYDTRLSYEGLRDKMTQGYILCALDYKFLILDNAFLIHRPGVKKSMHEITKTVVRQDRLINLKIKVELFKRFGKQEGCTL